MVRLFLILLAAAISFSGCASKKESNRPGLLARSARLIGLGKKQQPANQAVTHARNLDFTMQLEPLPVRLSDDRRINLQLSLVNRSRRFVHLEFPTTQRIEILVRDAGGNIVSRWSEDRAFVKEPGYVAINPRERIEYRTAVPTREMTAGKRYTIQAFFPDYERLKVQKTIVPEP